MTFPEKKFTHSRKFGAGLLPWEVQLAQDLKLASFRRLPTLSVGSGRSKPKEYAPYCVFSFFLNGIVCFFIIVESKCIIVQKL